MAFCHKCGAELYSDSEFCQHSGTPVKKEASENITSGFREVLPEPAAEAVPETPVNSPVPAQGPAAQPAVVQLPNQPAHVREDAFVPFEPAPLVFAHPVAVEVEHVQGDPALRHAVDHGQHGLFIVGGREGGREP